METQSIERVEQIGSLQRSIEEVKITSQDTYDRTVDLLGTVKSIMKEAPLVVRAKQAFEDANTAQKSTSRVWHTIWDPLVTMENMLKAKIQAWDRAKQAEEDERTRKAEAKRQADVKAEQDRLAAVAREQAAKEAAIRAEQMRKEAAEKAKLDAERMRREGESKRAIAEAAAKAKEKSDRAAEAARKQAEAESLARQQQENAEKIAAMEAAPLPIAKPAYERASEITVRDNWCWEFNSNGTLAGVLELVKHVAANPQDLYLLEPEKLVELHPALNKLAKAQKTMMRLPGGRAINKGVVAARGV